ncbi:MAG: hypothetical protein ACKVP4_13325 [Hyphomicrobium sp.]
MAERSVTGGTATQSDTLRAVRKRDRMMADIFSRYFPAGLATANVRYALLTWFGIVGGAITLFTNLSVVIDLADWLKAFADAWKAWSHAIWRWLFAWLGIDFPEAWAPVASFAVFLTSMMAGAYLAQRRAAAQEFGSPNGEASLSSARPLFLAGLAIASIASFAAAMFGSGALVAYIGPNFSPGGEILMAAAMIAGAALPAVLASRQKLSVALFAALYAPMFFTIVILPFVDLDMSAWSSGTSVAPRILSQDSIPMMVSLVLWITAPVLALALLPARVLNRKLLLLLTGVVVLAMLNWATQTDLAAQWRDGVQG